MIGTFCRHVAKFERGQLYRKYCQGERSRVVSFAARTSNSESPMCPSDPDTGRRSTPGHLLTHGSDYPEQGGEKREHPKT